MICQTTNKLSDEVLDKKFIALSYCDCGYKYVFVFKKEKITTYKTIKNGHNIINGFTVIKAKLVTMTKKFVVTISRR